jgi:DNA-binding transcriptional MerR regulator/methylmalonyl-CoA mutase cobalamin-binding subunit
MSAKRGRDGRRRGEGASGELRYALGAVARLTGLSPHVLRAWERRYGVVQPARSPGGTRRYSEAQVARLRLLCAGVDAGHPISELAPLDDAELGRLVGQHEERAQPRLREMFEVLDALDGAELERRLGMLLAALGPREFARSVATPLLVGVGERWQRGELRIAAEHAASAALRSLLGSALRFRPAHLNGSPRIVFATPASEAHELGLLMAAVCAQERGAHAVYLGCDLPAPEITGAASRAGASGVALSLVCLGAAAAAREIRNVRRALPERAFVWVGGAGSGAVELPAGVRRIDGLDDLERQVDLLVERHPAAGG